MVGLLIEYNKIPDINHLNQIKFFGRILNLMRLFKNCGHPHLNTKTFKLNQLVSLIMISTDINIDEVFCKALNKNDVYSIKEKLLKSNQFSISEVNTRLVIFALYFGDFSIKLPEYIIENAIFYTKNQIKFPEASTSIRNIRALKQINPLASTSFSLGMNNLYDEHKPSEKDGLISFLNKTHFHNANTQLIIITSSLVFFMQLPIIGPVGKNIHKDLINISYFMWNFFKKMDLSSQTSKISHLIGLKFFK